MFPEIASKFRDAASMFWEALDSQERGVVLYVGVYVLVSVAMALHGASRRRERDELRDEILEHVAAVHGGR